MNQPMRPMTNADLLAAWDAGEPVTLVEMGGISPDYEMAIQLTAMELLRDLEREPIPQDIAKDDHRRFKEILDARFSSIDPALKTLGISDRYGLSGAQVGAAQNAAWVIHRNGYASALAMMDDPERLIKLVKTPFTE